MLPSCRKTDHERPPDLRFTDCMQQQRRWAAVGFAAQVVFTSYWLVAPLWQGSAYSVVAHSISDMYAVTAPAGAVMVAVLTLCGAATIGFVVLALYPRLKRAGWTAVAGCVLLALSIFGLGDLLTPAERLACRLADPGCSPDAQVANAGGTLDARLSVIGIVSLVMAGFFIWAAMRRLPLVHAYARPVLVSTVMVLLAFLLVAVVPVGYAGLVERLVALGGAALIVTAALAVLRTGEAQAPLLGGQVT